MNSEMLNAAIGLIDVSLVEEHVVESERVARKNRIFGIVRGLSSAAACLAVLIAVVIIARMGFGDPAQQPPKGQDELPPNSGVITTTPPRDDDASAPTGNGSLKFAVSIGGKQYSVHLYPDMSPASEIFFDKVGELIGTATLCGTVDGSEMSLDCEVYTVIGRNDILAVKLPSGEYALALLPKTETIN